MSEDEFVAAEKALKDKGGAAFPSNGTYHSYNGMTLRDWFAGQALAGLIGKIGSEKEWSLVGEYCYNAADKLLATRKVSKIENMKRWTVEWYDPNNCWHVVDTTIHGVMGYLHLEITHADAAQRIADIYNEVMP